MEPSQSGSCPEKDRVTQKKESFLGAWEQTAES